MKILHSWRLLLSVMLVLPLSTAKTDSLLIRLQRSQVDEERVIITCELATAYKQEKPDSAMLFAREGYRLAKTISYQKGIAQTSAVLGDVFIRGNNLDSAKIFYQEAASTYLQLKELFEHVQCKMRLGNIELAQGNYFEALQLYEYCQPIAQENNFYQIIPHLYNNTGVIFLNLRDFAQALLYFEKALVTFSKEEDVYSASLARSNIAFIYENLGESDKSLDLYLDLVPIYLKDERWTNLADLYSSIASLHKQKGDLQSAGEYIDLALNMILKNRNNFRGPSSQIESRIYSTAAEIEYLQNNYTKSIEYARHSLDLATGNSYQAYIIRGARLMSDGYYALGIVDSALAYTRQYISNLDVVDEGKGIREVTQLRMQNDFKSKLREAELESVKQKARLQQRETLYLSAGIMALLFICILVLLFVNQRKKTAAALLRKTNLELEHQKLNSQMEYKNKELTLNMLYLTEKNEFITSIARKLEGMKPDVKRENRLLFQQIINEIVNNKDVGGWEEFELRFMEVHEDFYDALNKKFPDLTPNEKRLCAFLRLNMTTKEISAITHQSVQSINMARFRLRKKMNMEHDDNLISFLGQL
jgi:tetratricopeptide (TPR) repeat protein/DNA-binding CsgD family transcriptional regulator